MNIKLNLKGFRTFLYAAGLAVLGVLETTQWTDLITGENAGPWLTAIAVGVAVLRVLTKTAPGKGE